MKQGTTINKFPEVEKYTIRIEVPVEINCKELGISTDRISFMLSDILEHWSDGRRYFHVEMLGHAVEYLINAAVYKAIEENMEKQYKGEVVPYVSEDGRASGHTARWVIEAEKIRKKIVCWFRDRYIGLVKVDHCGD